MKIRVDIDVPKHKEQDMINVAYSYGFLREEPRKAWTEKERKEAIRYAFEQIVDEHIKARG